MIKTLSSTVIGGVGIWTPNTMIMGSINQNLSFLIRSLFRNNEQGFAYDLNDFSTLYQDAAGTIPVTGVGQPVGLVLDKSKGLALGGELRGAFTTLLTGSATPASYNPATGAGSISRVDVNNASFLKLATLTPQPHLLSITNTSNVDFTVRTQNTGQVLHTIVKNSTTAVCVVPSSVTTDITIFPSVNNATASFIINSIKLIAGNHAFQPTSSMRPLLQDAPRRVAYDAVDDKLTTNLPAQLTGCTVIRSIPNVGTQILINQTIPTPYNDSTNHCGLIVINRVLTAAEISQITKLFNKAAGV